MVRVTALLRMWLICSSGVLGHRQVVDEIALCQEFSKNSSAAGRGVGAVILVADLVALFH